MERQPKKRIPLYIKLAIEPLLTALASLIFYFILKDPTMSGVFAIVGFLISVNNVTVVYSIGTEIDKLNNTMKSEVGNARNAMCTVSTLCAEYLQITDKEFTPIRDELVTKTIQQLQDLKVGKHSLSGNEYYRWMSEHVKNCNKELIAISGMEEYLWLKEVREFEFLNDNIEVKKNKRISITRVHATKKERLLNFCNREVLERSLDAGIDVRIVYFKSITEHELQKVAEKGMLLVDDEILFLDVDHPTVEVSGIANKSQTDIARYKRHFSSLSRQSVAWKTARGQFFEDFYKSLPRKYVTIQKLLAKLESDSNNVELANDFMNWKSAYNYMIIQNYKSIEKLLENDKPDLENNTIKEDLKNYHFINSYDYTQLLLDSM